MARVLKVYAADLDGVHEWIVAASNQRAALDALGVHQDLFAQGRARVEDDPMKIEAAREQPGVALRRAMGSKGDFEAVSDDGGGGAWAAALDAAPKAGKPAPKGKAKPSTEPAKAEPKAKEPAAPPAKGASAAKGPSAADRMALRGAEALLRTFEREAVKEIAVLDGEQAELDRRKRKLEREHERRREALQRDIDKARAVVEA